MITQLIITNRDIDCINSLLAVLAKQFTTPEDPEFLHNTTLYAHDLPLRIRQFINDFRLKELDNAMVCVISGYPIDNQKIGLTPNSRGIKDDTQRTLHEQMLLALLASLLGEPVGWSTQQAGRIIHDVSPVEGQEHEQTGSSSQGELLFHTEDAFHPYRGDYFGMMCLRNHHHIPTLLASNQIISLLTEAEIRKLFEPCFVIRPDASQFEKHKFTALSELNPGNFGNLLAISEDKINQMNDTPEPVSVLFGDPTSPYMRVDCHVYMDALDDEAEAAIQALRRTIAQQQIELSMKAGEICFIDNYRAVHGRKPFSARYDGTDRWLKRINITRDLRKSRDMRISSTSRIIF